MVKRLEPIVECGILPIVRFARKEEAVPFAEALQEGGMPFMEVLCRTDAALDGIREIVSKYPDYLVGAGTILEEETAEKAIAAGAKFLVLPGFDPELICYGKRQEIPVIPGCATPGEVQQALRMGEQLLKFFPAEVCGGTEALKEWYGPYPEAAFIATSVPVEKVGEYLSCPNIAAVGGLFMYQEDCVRNGDFISVAEQIREFRRRYARNIFRFQEKKWGIRIEEGL